MLRIVTVVVLWAGVFSNVLANDQNDEAACILVASKIVPALDGIKLKSAVATHRDTNEYGVFYDVTLVVDILGNPTTTIYICKISTEIGERHVEILRGPILP